MCHAERTSAVIEEEMWVTQPRVACVAEGAGSAGRAGRPGWLTLVTTGRVRTCGTAGLAVVKGNHCGAVSVFLRGEDFSSRKQYLLSSLQPNDPRK